MHTREKKPMPNQLWHASMCGSILTAKKVRWKLRHICVEKMGRHRHGFLRLSMLASRTRTEHIVHDNLSLQNPDSKLLHQHNIRYIIYTSKGNSLPQLLLGQRIKKFQTQNLGTEQAPASSVNLFSTTRWWNYMKKLLWSWAWISFVHSTSWENYELLLQWGHGIALGVKTASSLPLLSSSFSLCC